MYNINVIKMMLLITQTEGTYDLTLSAFNPMDGWFNTEPTTVEVLSRVGPIIVDDFSLIRDVVSTHFKFGRVCCFYRGCPAMDNSYRIA